MVVVPLRHRETSMAKKIGNQLHLLGVLGGNGRGDAVAEQVRRDRAAKRRVGALPNLMRDCRVTHGLTP